MSKDHKEYDLVTAVTGATQPLIEHLEQRRLLSVGTQVPSDNVSQLPPVITIDWAGRRTQVVKDQWIILMEHDEPSEDKQGNMDSGVTFVADEHNRVGKQAMLDRVGLNLRFERNLGVDHMFTVRTPVGVTHAQLTGALRRLPGFISAEPVQIGVREANIPNDTDFSLQWGLSQASDKDIDAPEAWDYSTGWSGAAVAVIDSGVDLQHPDLDGNIWVNPGETAGDGVDNDGNGKIDDVNGWDFYGNGSTPDNNPDDTDGHGTAVAGIIAAEGNNGYGIAGVSWRNKIIALRDGDALPVSTHTIAAINYVTGLRQNRGINVRVINISSSIGASAALSSAIDSARTQGIIIVAAAGNSGADIDVTPVYPASYTHDNIISVAASNQTDGRWSSSNHGVVSVDLAAPGVDIDTLANGGGTTGAVPDGTSFAAPMVAGVAAMLFAVKPDAKYLSTNPNDPPGVINAILNNVDAVQAWSGYVKTGGRLNLFKAVQAIKPEGIPAKTFTGDANTAPTIDNVEIIPKPGDASTTQIKINGVLHAQVANSPSKRIDGYTLGANDTMTVASGVLNPIYCGGSEGNDNLTAIGASSKITLNGEAGNDTLIGGANDDSLEGSSGNDRLEGRGGNDYLYGVNQNDTIYGGAGNDTVYGGNGNDSLFGDDGADWIRAIDGVIDYGSGGAGNDTLDVDAIDQITQ